MTLTLFTGKFACLGDMRTAVEGMTPAPSLSLIEPKVSTGSARVLPIQRGRPDLATCQPETLRLCWPDGCLRIVSTGAGYAWVSVSDGQDPAWLTEHGEPGTVPDGIVELGDQDSLSWRSDLARFLGPRADASPETDLPETRLRLFSAAGRPFAWWLVPLDEKADSSAKENPDGS